MNLNIWIQTLHIQNLDQLLDLGLDFMLKKMNLNKELLMRSIQDRDKDIEHIIDESATASKILVIAVMGLTASFSMMK